MLHLLKTSYIIYSYIKTYMLSSSIITVAQTSTRSR